MAKERKGGRKGAGGLSSFGGSGSGSSSGSSNSSSSSGCTALSSSRSSSSSSSRYSAAAALAAPSVRRELLRRKELRRPPPKRPRRPRCRLERLGRRRGPADHVPKLVRGDGMRRIWSCEARGGDLFRRGPARDGKPFASFFRMFRLRFRSLKDPDCLVVPSGEHARGAEVEGQGADGGRVAVGGVGGGDDAGSERERVLFSKKRLSFFKPASIDCLSLSLFLSSSILPPKTHATSSSRILLPYAAATVRPSGLRESTGRGGSGVSSKGFEVAAAAQSASSPPFAAPPRRLRPIVNLENEERPGAVTRLPGIWERRPPLSEEKREEGERESERCTRSEIEKPPLLLSEQNQTKKKRKRATLSFAPRKHFFSIFFSSLSRFSLSNALETPFLILREQAPEKHPPPSSSPELREGLSPASGQPAKKNNRKRRQREKRKKRWPT